MSDLIDRQTAIDAVQHAFDRETLLNSFVRKVAVDALKTVPSAQPEPKRGKWIEYEQEFMLEEPLKTVKKTVRECSVCTAKIAGMVGIMNYCPNCGADMRG